MGKALASPKRLEIVDLLAQGERTVEEIARETAMSVASASQHLQALKAARMVEARREGLYMHYRLADEDVFRTGRPSAPSRSRACPRSTGWSRPTWWTGMRWRP